MIGTLFAQEFRSTRKSLLTSAGVALLVAAVSFGTALLRVPMLGGFGFGIGIIVVAMITPVALGLLAENYWRTMYGREGYFTMTIPVRGRTLFSAKVLYGLVVALVALVVTLLGAAAALVVLAVSQGASLSLAMEGLWNTIGVLDPAMTWFLVACAVLQLVFTVITGAAVMSIGAQARFNHLGFGAPVIGGIIVYVAMQVLGLAATLFVPFGMRITGPDAGTLVAEGMLHDFVAAVNDDAEPGVIGLGIVFVSIIATVLFAWWGARSVERRTSLR